MNLPDSTEIKKRQNEEENIMMQCASGYYYNIGERINYLCWLFCILSAVISFKSDQTFIMVIMIILDALAYVAGQITSWSVGIAGDLRKLFDARVLFDNDDVFDISKKRYLKEKAIRIINLNKEHYEKISKTDGTAKPRGKMNWYTFKNDLEPIYAQFECQGQNKWWNDKMVRIRICIWGIIGVAVLCTGVLILCKFSLPRAGVINAIVIICSRMVERIINNYKYLKISGSIDTTFELASRNKSLELVEELQRYIDERRHLPVFEMNIVHRLSAAKYTKLYNQI